jgi:Holliday junction resolvase-like predicted endonuclease
MPDRRPRHRAAHPDPDAIERDIRDQARVASFAVLVGIFFLGTFVAVGPERFPGLWALLPPAAGIGALGYARTQFRQVRARRHGLAVEHKAVRQALKVLRRRGYAATANVASPCGDLDLVVEGARGPVPIEIKSFHSWGGRCEGRCDAALEQVERQQRYLAAEHAFIWLPNARVGLWRRWFGTDENGTRIIYGMNAKALVRFLRRAGE